MTVKDLKRGDIVELWWDDDFRMVLSDEFDIDANDNTFVTDEDSEFRSSLTDEFDFNIKDNTFVRDEDDAYMPFDYISKIWREDDKGNYILIYTKNIV